MTPKIRDLRVTDIRCTRCGAGPGQRCKGWDFDSAAGAHPQRLQELAELVEDGWQWQEVNPRDEGAVS